MAVPVVLLVQLRQVMSSLPENARPSGCEPVRMSCMFGLSPLALMVSPFSLSPVSLLILLLLLCRSSTSLAMTTPLVFCHGPLPMRSRALTAGLPSAALVLKYACHVLPAPTAWASAWQCLSAPAKPPRSAPLPEPTLVMKKVMLVFGSCELAIKLSDSSTTNTARETHMLVFIVTLLSLVGENNYLPRQCNFVLVREREIRTRFTKVACHA